jgi:hypothetical protein
VDEVSPACLEIGHFARSGRKGLNRVRFAGVVNGTQLTPGTYRISIRTAAGKVIRRVMLVVVRGAAPSVAELRALRSANTCSSAIATATSAAGTATATASATLRPLPIAASPQQGAAAGLVPQAPQLHSGILATSLEKTARAIEPALVALLALAILLLGLASLPQEAVPGPRLHDTLARHRLELAALGTAALVSVALVLLLT